jgi:hypothetical protein
MPTKTLSHRISRLESESTLTSKTVKPYGFTVTQLNPDSDAHIALIDKNGNELIGLPTDSKIGKIVLQVAEVLRKKDPSIQIKMSIKDVQEVFNSISNAI